jgi:hypothetical protein
MKDRLLNVHYITVGVVIFLLSDVLLLLFPGLINLRISYFLKGAVLVYYSFLVIRLLVFKETLFLLMFLILFIASQSYLFFFKKINFVGILDNLRFFTWYLFGCTLMLIYDKYCSMILKPRTIHLFNKIALIIISVVCISILVGFIFDLKIFWSYNKDRWGYKGILSKSVTASYFFIITLSYLYYCYVILKRKYSFFLIVLFCSLLCGTKTIYLFILLQLIFHIVQEKKYKLKSFWYSFVVFFALIWVFRNILLEKTEFFLGLFYKLYQEKGFMYSFSSFRSEMLIEGISYYCLQWDWVNYIIGGRLIEIKYFEMSFFDLFYFFGIIGFFLFVFMLIKYVVIPFYKQTKVYGLFIMFSIFLASFFTGQFFINSTVMILFFFYLFVIQANTKLN